MSARLVSGLLHSCPLSSAAHSDMNGGDKVVFHDSNKSQHVYLYG